MSLNSPIGVFDSGAGGLSVLKVLHTLLPHEDFIYVGDSARAPYGVRSEAQLREFVEDIISYLERQGVKEIAIACNTTTMLGVASLKKNHPFRLVGMSKGAKLLLQISKNKKIGVMATPFTISTEAHKKEILAVDPTAQVYPMPCAKFVPLIEGEQFDTPELDEAVKEYSLPLKEAGIDTLILSCTHYPFVKPQIEACLGAGVKVVDPAEETASQVKKDLEEQGLLRTTGTGKLKICVTGNLESTKRLFQYMLPGVEAEFALVDLKD